MGVQNCHNMYGQGKSNFCFIEELTTFDIVKVPKFPTHGNFPYFLARDVARFGEFSQKKK
jgi:hypothetical protein